MSMHVYECLTEGLDFIISWEEGGNIYMYMSQKGDDFLKIVSLKSTLSLVFHINWLRAPPAGKHA